MTAGKVILGIVLLLVGLYLLLPASWMGLGLWEVLWVIILGTVPIMLVLLGLMLIWIEAEELKTVKPVAAAKPKARKRKR